MSNRRRPLNKTAQPLPEDVEIAEVVIDKTGDRATATVRTRKAAPQKAAKPKATRTVTEHDVKEHLDPVGSLCGHVDELGNALGAWNQRTGAAGPLDAGLRGAANRALVNIDHMVDQLRTMRSRLVTEVRRHDEATARRADRLLQRSTELGNGTYGVRDETVDDG
jgi:hypothetical protein